MREHARAVSAGAGRRQATATRYRLDYDRPKSIGRVRSFFGNVGILVPRLLLHPHARPRRAAASQRERRAQRQLSAAAASRTSCPCRTATAACTSSSPAAAKLKARTRHLGDGHRQAAARLRLPRADGLLPAGRARSDDDRADRDREQGNARRLRRDAVPHHRGGSPTCCTKRRTPRRSAGPTKSGRPASRLWSRRQNQFRRPSSENAVRQSARHAVCGAVRRAVPCGEVFN